nr:unnamed protein product [Callosobruchus analis]
MGHMDGLDMLDPISTSSMTTLTPMSETPPSHMPSYGMNHMMNHHHHHHHHHGGGPLGGHAGGGHPGAAHHAGHPAAHHPAMAAAAAAAAVAGLHPDADTDPRELEAFAERFKQRRIKLGVTQADVVSCQQHFYADDTQVYISFSPDEASQAICALNLDLNLLYNNSSCLKLNPLKSSKATLKNLRLTLDDNMRFSDHIKHKLQSAYLCLETIYQNRQYLSMSMKKMLCDSLVPSHLNYVDDMQVRVPDPIHNNMIALKPILQAWLEEAEAQAKNKRRDPDAPSVLPAGEDIGTPHNFLFIFVRHTI